MHESKLLREGLIDEDQGVGACRSQPGGARARVASASAKPVYGAWGYDATAMDRGVKPGDDFFDYVNGTWAKRTEIAPDRTFVGIDSVLNDQIERDVRAIVEDMAKDPSANGKLGQQIGDLYASWMDEAAVEQLGTPPLQALSRSASPRRRPAPTSSTCSPSPASTRPIDLSIYPDLKDPTRYSAYVSQGGLGMPNRDYYLLKGEKYDAYRKAYRDYIVKMRAARRASATPKRAPTASSRSKRRSRSCTGRPSRAATSTSLQSDDPGAAAGFAPQLDWDRALTKLGLGNVEQVVVGEKSAIQGEASCSPRCRCRRGRTGPPFTSSAPTPQYLPKAFDEANFDFYSKTLRDVPAQRARWKRGVDMLDGALGEGVGQIYVQRHYPAESDRQMHELIEQHPRRAQGEDLRAPPGWTRRPAARALEKLATFDPRIGHPVKYIDYSSLDVKRGDLLGNAIRSDDFEWKLLLSRFPKPVDRTLWDMPPQTNNAYYDPTHEPDHLPGRDPAAALFRPERRRRLNYGSIGATIGHEIGHGFDDQGRKFDAHGRAADWWSARDGQALHRARRQLVAQYNGYEPIPGRAHQGPADARREPRRPRRPRSRPTPPTATMSPSMASRR